MNRRDFLKVSGLFSFILAAPLGNIALMPVVARAQNLLYRGTTDGKFYVSQDAGDTWLLHSALGQNYSVLSIFTDHSKRVHALIGFAGRRFNLILDQNGKSWRTL